MLLWRPGMSPNVDAAASASATASATAEPEASATTSASAEEETPKPDPAAAARAQKLSALRKKIKAGRARQLDAQCKKFKAGFGAGYIYQGGTFAEAEYLANANGCLALAKTNKAPWFCCKR
jgi:hypothetical protein